MAHCMITVRKSSGIEDVPTKFYANIHTGTLHVGSTLMVKNTRIGSVTGIWLNGHILPAVTPGYEVLVDVDTPYAFEEFEAMEITA